MTARRFGGASSALVSALAFVAVLVCGATLGMQYAESTLALSRGEIRCERVEVVPAGAYSVARCVGGGR